MDFYFCQRMKLVVCLLDSLYVNWGTGDQALYRFSGACTLHKVITAILLLIILPWAYQFLKVINADFLIGYCMFAQTHICEWMMINDNNKVHVSYCVPEVQEAEKSRPPLLPQSKVHLDAPWMWKDPLCLMLQLEILPECLRELCNTQSFQSTRAFLQFSCRVSRSWGYSFH